MSSSPNPQTNAESLAEIYEPDEVCILPVNGSYRLVNLSDDEPVVIFEMRITEKTLQMLMNGIEYAHESQQKFVKEIQEIYNEK